MVFCVWQEFTKTSLTKVVPDSGGCSNTTNDTVYYGVYTPIDNNKDLTVPCNVFEDKMEALKLAKKNKKSRFKAFQFYHEALEFALNGSEWPNSNTTAMSVVGEKGSPFKGPKPQELVELRKTIEVGNYKLVKEMIWQNPRYLVNSGDTPSILQEGSRVNALHIAAKAKNAAITELILNTITDVEFIKFLYGDDNHQNAEDRAKILLDLYLNTPNKGLNETPLHFASKHGAVDVVEILVSYPQCDRTLKNKFEKTAEQIICERSDDTSVTTKQKISNLLQDNYYVPVLRSEDNSVPPAIGIPFSPTSPPVLNSNPINPRLEIHAYAGPMNKSGAEQFRKVWKTPPRSLKFNNNSIKNDYTTLRFRDPEKGLERIGKQLANKFDVTWKEFWPFLDCFIDISSEDGLGMLENHLNKVSEILRLEKTELSPMSNLCNALQAIRLNDSNNLNELLVDPLLHIENSCQVFANRISNDILYILWEYDNIAAVLDTEIKQLELLVTSYMDDNRFAGVNFQKVHARLGMLIGRKLVGNNLVKENGRMTALVDKLESVLDSIIKSLDCFSSDDEGLIQQQSSCRECSKPTMYRQQVICLILYILSVLTQNSRSDDEDCGTSWNSTEECACVYHVRKVTKRNSLSRNNSFKQIKFGGADVISRKLNFDEGITVFKFSKNGGELKFDERGVSNTSSSDEDDDDDCYYTPPSSPSFLKDDSDDDEFVDTELPKFDVFIEGDCPSKTDYAVFNALKNSECVLTAKLYPNIFKWKHNVELYSEEERESWPSPKYLHKHRKKTPTKQPFSPPPTIYQSPVHTSTPTKSWLRITGANSPRAVFTTKNNYC